MNQKKEKAKERERLFPIERRGRGVGERKRCLAMLQFMRAFDRRSTHASFAEEFSTGIQNEANTKRKEMREDRRKRITGISIARTKT
jgi:hypothetical protein